MSIQVFRRAFVSGSDKGGCGKTFSLVLVAAWLQSKGLKRVYIDADTGNRDTEGSFENFLKDQPVTKINIQDQEDLDSIFNIASKSTVDVLVDLPSNSSGNIFNWFHDVISPDALDAAGIQLVTLIPITPTDGIKSALKYLETVGPIGTFIICLNRIGYQLAPKPKEILFKDWFAVEAPQEYDIRTIEIGHLDTHAKVALTSARCLPSQITGVEALVENRIKKWSEKVYAQLEAIGL